MDITRLDTMSLISNQTNIRDLLEPKTDEATVKSELDILKEKMVYEIDVKNKQTFDDYVSAKIEASRRSRNSILPLKPDKTIDTAVFYSPIYYESFSNTDSIKLKKLHYF